MTCYLCRKTELTEIHPRTRDRDDIRVVKCNSCTLVQLHPQPKEKPYASDHGDAKDMAAWKKRTFNDDKRRMLFMHEHFPDGGTIVDFGCGNAQFGAMMRPEYTVYDVDQGGAFRHRGLGDRLPEPLQMDAPVDIVTMFHVLEHLPNPIAALIGLISKCQPDHFVIEVPHADNALFQLESFRDFSYWSEHRFMFTVRTLNLVLDAAGLKLERVYPVNRYGPENVLSFFVYGRPGKYMFTDSKSACTKFDEASRETMQTDTLLVIASRK